MSNIERINDIKNEMARTQKNKATAHHLALLKARLSKLTRELVAPPKGAKKKGSFFEVRKSGIARIGFIGFPSVGKSTLMNQLTNAKSVVAEYEFTTLKTVPGIMEMHQTKLQILDLPGIIKGASLGSGRGKQVLSVAKTCNLLVIVLDSTKSLTGLTTIKDELEAVGIRLNKEKPKIKFSTRERGGVNLISSVKIDEAVVKDVLKEYRINSCEIIIEKDYSHNANDAENEIIDDIIDTIEMHINPSSIVYIPCLYLLNKVDRISLAELEVMCRLRNSFPISSFHAWGIERLKDKIWKELNLIRIFPKPKNMEIDDPVVLRRNSTVADFCDAIHKNMKEKVTYAWVWGASVKHNPQRVGKEHVLYDGDVIQIVKQEL
ncbi:GTP-binding protein DRG1 (ODN superfamily) [Trachipleistophora hominis]|uniref:GTP-binding protein DRG1 (ODN superfamily) n=1 Tax=Trachipleistophora hominis TaxID=72359 RepID=L7JYE6_TRAHO|nr:GTP-binding protein DRG1 (ODN superfamily) [Trachipleistophora hominis]